MRNDNVKPDWWCIALDETGYWSIDEADRPYIEKIVGVYFYDANEYTYCCEITPSYFLRSLGSSIWFTSDTPDDKREELDVKYREHESYDDHYMHVRAVKGIPEDRKHHFGTLDDAEPEDNQEDCVREYYSGNPAF